MPHKNVVIAEDKRLLSEDRVQSLDWILAPLNSRVDIEKIWLSLARQSQGLCNNISCAWTMSSVWASPNRTCQLEVTG